MLAPVLVSVLLIGAGAGMAARERWGKPLRVGRIHWIAGALSLALLLYSFMANHPVAYAGGTPTSFPWIPHIAALLIGAGAAVHLLRR